MSENRLLNKDSLVEPPFSPQVLDKMEIGTSLFDQAGADIVGEIMEMAKAKGVEIVLPVDFVVSNKFGEDGEIKTATVSPPPPHLPLCNRMRTTPVQLTWNQRQPSWVLFFAAECCWFQDL
jgi:hypothetical protein